MHTNFTHIRTYTNTDIITRSCMLLKLSIVIGTAIYTLLLLQLLFTLYCY